MKKKIITFVCVLLTCASAFALMACGGDYDEPIGSEYKEINYYYTNGGKGIRYGGVSQLNDEDREREGFVFGGAYVKPNGEGTQVIDENGRIYYGRVESGRNVYAYWIPEQCTVILMDGDAEFRKINVTYGGELSAFLDVPPKTNGKIFCGWMGTLVKNDTTQSVQITNSNGIFLSDKNTVKISNGWYVVGDTITLRAEYEYEKYDITLNYNGLQDNAVIQASYDHAIENLPSLQAVDGYEFLGWSYENSNTNYVLYNGEKITGPLTLYAITMRYREFDIMDGDGNLIGSKRVYDNGTTVRLAELELELPAGYKATNWYSNQSMSGSSRITAVNYSSVWNTLYVDIEAIEYSCELVFGKDVSVSGANTQITYTCEDIVPLPNAEKEHCTFLGWFTENGSITTPIKRIPKGTTGNLELYPKFRGVDVTLNLNAQNGESESSVQREYGQNFTLDIPSRYGYTCLGWYDSESGGTKYVSANGKSVKAIDFVEPLTLYAQWIINEYTVEYVDGDGNIITTQTYEHGQKLEFPVNPTDGKLTFSGWYDKDFKEPVTEGGKVTSDMTVYALFVTSKAISTAEELKEIAKNPSGNYHLTADINLYNETWTPINEFNGILDGKGHKIFNFGLSLSSDARYFGFIGKNNGTVKNLLFTDFTYNVTASVTVNNWITQLNYAVICGENNGTLSDCTVSNYSSLKFNVSISASEGGYRVNGELETTLNMGVIAGSNNGLIINTASAAVIHAIMDVTSKTTGQAQSIIGRSVMNAGSMAGSNRGKVTLCESDWYFEVYSHLYTDAVSMSSATSEFNSCIGGTVGNNYAGSVSKCLARSTMDIMQADTAYVGDQKYSWRGHYNAYPLVGGSVGCNSAKVSSCYATGTIKGRNFDHCITDYGGFAARNEQSGEINDCYCDTTVIVNTGVADTGGFVGCNGGKIQNCYSAGAVSVEYNNGLPVGAFIGYIAPTGSVTGCFTLGSVSAERDVKIGKCIAGNDGSIRKCYYGENVVTTINGNAVDGNHNGTTGKPESELISVGFLVDELFWDSEVWVIDGVNRPKLVWQD